MSIEETVTVTPERRKHGKIVEAARTATSGGNVASIGQHDAWAFYPDFLLEQNLLGPDADATRRRNAAFSFFELWAKTHRSEKSNIGDFSPGGQPGERRTEEADTGSYSACLEMEWLLVTRYLGSYRREVEWVCLELVAPAYPVSLDGLGALKRSERPQDLRLAATLIEKRQLQQKAINTHIGAFLARSGVIIDALDALEKVLEKAHEQVWKDRNSKCGKNNV